MALFAGRRFCTTAEYIIQEAETPTKNLRAPVIWKSSSQISNFKKCSINCAVVIQCQQVTHARSSLDTQRNKSLCGYINIKVKIRRTVCQTDQSRESARSCDERTAADDGNRESEAGEGMRETTKSVAEERGGGDGRRKTKEKRREERRQNDGNATRR